VINEPCPFLNKIISKFLNPLVAQITEKDPPIYTISCEMDLQIISDKTAKQRLVSVEGQCIITFELMDAEILSNIMLVEVRRRNKDISALIFIHVGGDSPRKQSLHG
jgi:hypothetical protein